jgi:diketogulonate reductase-like aldo/keto reductase
LVPEQTHRLPSHSAGGGSWRDSWRAFEQLKESGFVRTIGVSNFDLAELEELLRLATVPPAVVQNWFDPFHQDREVRHLCADHGVVYQGYSVLGNGWVDDGLADVSPVLGSELVAHIAKRYSVSAAQVVLRWAYQESVATIVRTTNRLHLAESLDIFNFGERLRVCMLELLHARFPHLCIPPRLVRWTHAI